MGNILMLFLITLVLTAPCCCEGDTTRPLDDGLLKFFKRKTPATGERGAHKIISCLFDNLMRPSFSSCWSLALKEFQQTFGVKLTRETANTFVKRQKRSYPYYERYYEMFKTPLEMKQERCENYAPCDFYSERVGFHTAYSYYFGNV